MRYSKAKRERKGQNREDILKDAFSPREIAKLAYGDTLILLNIFKELPLYEYIKNKYYSGLNSLDYIHH